jgi:seryl-tRNA synthetase
MADIADLERGAQVAGGRGYFLKGAGVQLNLALINYGISFLVGRKYEHRRKRDIFTLRALNCLAPSRTLLHVRAPLVTVPP